MKRLRFTKAESVTPGESANPDGYYTIAPLEVLSCVLGIYSGSIAACANIQKWRENETGAQVFRLTYKDGYYALANAK